MLIYLQPHVTLPTSQHAAGPRTPQTFSFRLAYSRYWEEASKGEYAEMVRESFFDDTDTNTQGRSQGLYKPSQIALIPSTPH